MPNKIRMTKKGNVIVGGVKYHAEPNDGCLGCAFRHDDCGGIVCETKNRRLRPTYKHQTSVIFVKRGLDA